MKTSSIATHTLGSRSAHSVAANVVARRTAETGTPAQLAALIIAKALVREDVSR